MIVRPYIVWLCHCLRVVTRPLGAGFRADRHFEAAAVRVGSEWRHAGDAVRHFSARADINMCGMALHFFLAMRR
jgi:hypothetical protein